MSVKLVDFYADWCGPCRAMEPVLEELKSEMAGKITIEKVDVDKEQERASSLGVLALPTFHVMKDDKIIEVLTGYRSKDDLKQRLEAAMAS